MKFPVLLLIYFCSMICFLFSINYSLGRCKKIILFFLLLITVLFVGLRNDFSYDTEMYMLFYDDIPALKNLSFDLFFNPFVEPGFLIIGSILKTIFGEASYSILFICLASLIFLPLILGISCLKYTQYPFFPLYVYMSTMYVLFPLVQIRQGIALAIVFYGLKYVLNKSLINYIVICLFASLFHYSAVISLIIYPLFKIRWNYTKMIIVLISSYLVSCYNFVSLFEDFLMRFDITKLSNIVGYIGMIKYSQDTYDGYGVYYRGLALIILVLFTYKISNKSLYYPMDQLIMSMLSALILIRGAFVEINIYASRLSEYFFLVILIVLPRLYNIVPYKKIYCTVILILCTGCFFYVCYILRIVNVNV